MDINDIELAAWAEDTIRFLIENDVDKAAFVMTLRNGNTATSYFNADAEDMAVFAHNINADVVLEIVKANGREIRDAWEDDEE